MRRLIGDADGCRHGEPDPIGNRETIIGPHRHLLGEGAVFELDHDPVADVDPPHPGASCRDHASAFHAG